MSRFTFTNCTATEGAITILNRRFSKHPTSDVQIELCEADGGWQMSCTELVTTRAHTVLVPDHLGLEVKRNADDELTLYTVSDASATYVPPTDIADEDPDDTYGGEVDAYGWS